VTREAALAGDKEVKAPKIEVAAIDLEKDWKKSRREG
jgi:hypothetical protein